MSQQQQSSGSNGQHDIMQLLAMLADRKDELGSLLALCDSSDRRGADGSGSGGNAKGSASDSVGEGDRQEQQGDVERRDEVRLHGGGVDAVSDSSGFTSWSDAVEAESETGASVDGSVVGVPVAPQRVREAVVFGGFGTAVEPAPVAEEVRGVMSTHVRIPNARGIRRVLSGLGISLPKQSAYDVALVTHTSATMPGFFRSGKQRLRAFAVLSARALERGDAVESLQSVRATSLTDGNMARQFSTSSCAPFVTVGAGVSLAHTKTGATALEAVVGLVAYYRTPRDVSVLAGYFGLL